MTDLAVPADFERLITLGLSRGGADDSQALATLAVLAQRKRHRRAAATPVTADMRGGALHDDPRPIMPEAARRPLVRLVGSLNKDGAQFLAQPIFERLAQHGVRLHPFDLPRLEPLLTAAPDQLGPAERAWQNIKRSPQSDAAIAPTVEDEWVLLPKPQKVAIIRQLRATDPAAARGRIERHLSGTPADVRAALIGALDVNLSEADVPYLTAVAQDDRAATVREAATNLMASIRGTPAYDARLVATKVFIEVSRTMLRRRTVKFKTASLDDRLPTGATSGQRAMAVSQLLNQELQGLHFSEIAKQLELSPIDLAAALATDDPLTMPLIGTAIIEGDEKTLSKLAPQLAKVDLMDLIRSFGAMLVRLSSEARASLLRAAAQTPKLNWFSPWDLALLGHLAGGIVPEALARKLLSTMGRAGPEAGPAPQREAVSLAMFATLMPPGLDAEFGALIADLPRKETAAAYEFISFTTALQEAKA
jgi:hypothetical protein